MREFDAKPAYKLWAAVLDEEAKPLTEDELASESPTFQAAYRHAMAEDPLPPDHPALRPPVYGPRREGPITVTVTVRRAGKA